MRLLLLTLVLMIGSLSELMAQPAVKSVPPSEAAQRLRTLLDTAKKGDMSDLGEILVRVRDSVASDRTCDQPGRICDTRNVAIEVLVTWVEIWADKCPQYKVRDDTDQRLILDLRAQLEALASSLRITVASTRVERDKAKRLQDALDKLQRCQSLLWREARIWFASVAPDIPTHAKEQWMVNCSPTPFGRWTIMRTEGPAAASHEILGGVLDMKENGKGEYTLNGIGKSNRRGAYKETGIAELSEMPGAPGQYLLVLKGTWSDRVADGRGGWVAKNFKFGDISFQVEQRSMQCPVASSKQ